jgi:hypothetical protein
MYFYEGIEDGNSFTDVRETSFQTYKTGGTIQSD